MSVTATNTMLGPVSVWTGVFGATEPINAGAAPGTGWVDAGGTEGGATLTLGQTYTNKTVDQVAMPVGAGLSGQAATVATSLAEPTLANLRLGLNQATGAGTTLEVLGEDLTNTDPLYTAILLLGKKPGGGPRMWILRRTLSTASIGVPFKKDGQTLFPITWSAYYVSSSIKAVRIDDTPGP